jgi:predicted Zn-dependent protease
VIAFDGTFHDGRTARAVPVRVEVDGDSITVCDGVVAGRIAGAGIVADAPIPGVPRTLRLPGGESIETADHAAVAGLWPERGPVARLAFALESRWPAALAAIVATAAGVWFVVAVALPRAADPVARRISPEVERRLGEHALATLDRLILKPSQLSAEEQEAWEEKFEAFVAGEPGRERYAIVFRDARLPNAFALPGGTIVVTDAMVRAVGSDDELRAVLAHEIGHVRGRHALRLVLQDSGIAVLATALAGDAAGISFLAVALPSMLLQSRYSREFEAEADDYAFAHLKRHGVSPQAFAKVMRRLEEAEGAAGSDDAVGRWLGSHPATEERIRRAEDAR